MKEIRPRWVAPKLQAALKVLPVVVVIGARQTGKTTLVRSLSPGRPYFTLDDSGLLGQARREPEALLADRPITLDEVQRAPELLLALKRAVDERRQAGDFLQHWASRTRKSAVFGSPRMSRRTSSAISANSARSRTSRIFSG